MQDEKRLFAPTSPGLDPEALRRAQRATALEQLFQVFSGATPEKIIAYVKAAEGLDPKDLAIACIRLVERWTKTTVPPFAVVRETTLEIAGERIARGETYTKHPTEVRELIQRRLSSLQEDHGDRTKGIASRIKPHEESWIQAHWEQFRETFHWPPYSA